MDEGNYNRKTGDDVELTSKDQELVFNAEREAGCDEDSKRPEPEAAMLETIQVDKDVQPKFKETKKTLVETKTQVEKDDPMLGLDGSKTDANQKVPLKTIDQLLIHYSDTAVKPIIGNKDIEKHGELVFNAQLLPFEAWTADTVSQKIDTPPLENHLHEVYNAMGASSTVNDKLNVLIYFESIILNSNVANRLINSAFMSILLKLLKNVKSPHLKMRLCSILG
jgi:serine/threonine-protein kinase ULK4